LARLHYLGLSGISLPELSALLPFQNLRSLFVGFCKPINLGQLGRFAGLEALHLIKINNLGDSALAATSGGSSWNGCRTSRPCPISRDSPGSRRSRSPA
jgi:hypothetical protein